MNTTRHIVAAAVGMALLGLAAGTSNAAPAQPHDPVVITPGAGVSANPAPPPVLFHGPVDTNPRIPLGGQMPTVSADGRVVQGLNFSVNLQNWPTGSVRLFVDSPSGLPIGSASSSGSSTLQWPWNSPAGGYHELYAAESVGAQTVTAETRVWVDFAPQ